MRVFEIGSDRLVPFEQVLPGPDLYEDYIESLLWSYLEDLTGFHLFPVARQPVMGEGLRPDIVALDADGHIHVIEVKRDIDRLQLAQCMEYAAQARAMRLGDLERMYHGGPDEFNSRWTEFTGTRWQLQIQQPVRLVLVAGDFDDRTKAVLETQFPKDGSVIALRVNVYEDQVGRRVLTVGEDRDWSGRPAAPSIPSGSQGASPSVRRRERDVRHSRASVRQARRTSQASKMGHGRGNIRHLIDAGLIEVNTRLTCTQKRKGITHWATVLESGWLNIGDGSDSHSPSSAATAVLGRRANGLKEWKDPDDRSLRELQDAFDQSLGDGLPSRGD